MVDRLRSASPPGGGYGDDFAIHRPYPSHRPRIDRNITNRHETAARIEISLTNESRPIIVSDKIRAIASTMYEIDPEITFLAYFDTINSPEEKETQQRSQNRPKQNETDHDMTENRRTDGDKDTTKDTISDTDALLTQETHSDTHNNATKNKDYKTEPMKNDKNQDNDANTDTNDYDDDYGDDDPDDDEDNDEEMEDEIEDDGYEETSYGRRDTNKEFVSMDEFPNNENRFSLFFPTKFPLSRNQNKKIIVGLRFLSEVNLNTFRQSQRFRNTLQEQNAFFYEHKFSGLLLSRVGFMIGKAPSLVWRQTYEQTLRQRLQEQLRTSDQYDDDDLTQHNGKVPSFCLFGRNIIHRTEDEKYSTYAFEIQCETEHYKLLLNLFSDTPLDTRLHGMFVPFTFAGINQTIYVKQIIAQNHFLNEVTKIPVVGIHCNAMTGPITCDSTVHSMHDFYMKASHETKEGTQSIFLSIEETNRTDDIGKWFFVVLEQDHHAARQYLDQHLHNIYPYSQSYPTIQDAFQNKRINKPHRTDTQPKGYSRLFSSMNANSSDIRIHSGLTHYIDQRPPSAQAYMCDTLLLSWMVSSIVEKELKPALSSLLRVWYLSGGSGQVT
eukprot:Pompholyxophrys_punicea_v1_NODE_25_length_5265_cov_107.938388.p1 type:complete len:609 gc:universal NODE_25_length_5265_cov_107.938388:3171-4997(+)